MNSEGNGKWEDEASVTREAVPVSAQPGLILSEQADRGLKAPQSLHLLCVFVPCKKSYRAFTVPILF
jgi:hypothetical protein